MARKNFRIFTEELTILSYFKIPSRAVKGASGDSVITDSSKLLRRYIGCKINILSRQSSGDIRLISAVDISILYHLNTFFPKYSIYKIKCIPLISVRPVLVKDHSTRILRQSDRKTFFRH